MISSACRIVAWSGTHATSCFGVKKKATLCGLTRSSSHGKLAVVTDHGHGKASLRALTIGALGIVFGDIGTSPLYTLQGFTSAEGIEMSPDNVMGIISLIVWAVTLVVTIKYLTFVMRADNEGEGGILALLALIPEKLRTSKPGRVAFIATLVVIGAALLYGDGMITPAISVLSAMEGLAVATDKLKPAILPLTCAVLFGLFLLQRHGTGGIGRFFGPIMITWFTTIAVLGAIQVVKEPRVLEALSPHMGAKFLIRNKWAGFELLGVVALAVTGGEALYADMGHFGPKPIRISWLGLVMPSLVLAYLGQGSLLIAHGDVKAVVDNPFFALVPTGPITYALVALAAAATVIASQALISGAFSLTHQAVQLGFFPRVTVKHTSHETEGQIYIPEVNWFLAIAAIGLVLAFQESQKMGAAYGIAVCGTMSITSFVFYVVARRTWGWPMWKAGALLLFFLSFDAPLFGANILKFLDGGWVPVVIATAMFLIMIVWNVGRTVLNEYVQEHSPPWDEFLGEHAGDAATRSPGVGVFMAYSGDGVPQLVAHHAEQLHTLPKTSIVLSARFDKVPVVSAADRIEEAVDLGRGFYRVRARFGYMQSPEVLDTLAQASKRLGIAIDPAKVTYFLGRETFLATKAGKLGPWTESFFGFLKRNSKSASAYFALPPEQVVELGAQIDL
jgi:KUP system potassium uptake protein